MIYAERHGVEEATLKAPVCIMQSVLRDLCEFVRRYPHANGGLQYLMGLKPRGMPGAASSFARAAAFFSAAAMFAACSACSLECSFRMMLRESPKALM